MENSYKYSEYQTSFYNLNNHLNSSTSSFNQIDRPQLVKSKDTLSFGNKRLISDPPYIFNTSNNDANNFQFENNTANLHRSKTLNRLNNMMPENNLSWYKGDYGFYGTNNENNSNNSNSNNYNDTANFKNHISPREPYNALNRYKLDHIKRFDELNSGLADSYSMTKGGALLSIRNNNNGSSSNLMENVNAKNSNEFKIQNVRPHDLRSVWIPKKFEGRNMFASHIDSTIFPDKAKNKPLLTQYNQNYDLTMESKKVFEKPTYDKIEKSVRYSVSHEGRLIPNIIWQPHLNSERYRGEPVMPLDPNQKPKTIYQVDFDSASLLKLNSINNSNDTKIARQNGTATAASNSNLNDLKKRRDQIDQALLKLNS